MIVLLLGLTMLLILATARRALEPACPNCDSKRWIAHSTQLQCECCGWSNGRVPAAEAVAVAVEPQYEICFNG
jgi:hypothetical protein